MSILSRYIAGTWLRLFALCLGSFVSIYLVLDMMDKIPRYLRVGASMGDITGFFLNKLPEMVGQTAAFSTLMATLLTLGLLSRSSEITAMRSCGISLMRISFPMLLLGMLISALLLVNAELIIPASYQKMDYIERVKIKKQGVNAVFKLNNIWYRNDRMILQAMAFDPQKSMLKGVTIWTMDDSLNPVSRIDAERAEFKDGHWTLKQLQVKDFSTDVGYRATVVPSMEVAINLKVDDLKVLDNNADNLSYGKLRDYAENLQRGGFQAFRYLTMMHSKLSTPFAAFVMVLLGIPFAMKNSRSGGVALGIGASVGIGFGYFVINAVLLSYGRSGVLPALPAAWGANLIFSLVGVWMAMTVKR
ncbi:MAG: LPS export ABC transporter permease LptG [Geobacter sp.]|nr:LPS export ABC transporter permease LptG [Geobacter sp.]